MVATLAEFVSVWFNGVEAFMYALKPVVGEHFDVVIARFAINFFDALFRFAIAPIGRAFLYTHAIESQEAHIDTPHRP